MKLEVLGNIQDGGVPHLGCDCDICEKARGDCNERRYCSSLLLKENSENDSVRYLIEATPDIRLQIKGYYLDGVFLPHENLGHITGLLYFGEEGLDAKELNVYCNEDVEDFLMKNDPYRLLIDRGNIELQTFEDDDRHEIQGGTIQAKTYHHAQFTHDTTAYTIKGEEKTVFYLPDITEFTEKIKQAIREADVAIIDGTFWSRDEIDRYEEVPHPPIKETINEMDNYETEIYFTHMNHTNPVLREESKERNKLEEKGFEIAKEGMEIDI